ncbi:MAG TPA: phosphate-starvation-inducible PsiE family protein [Candidatus Acidoferrales bacterium]|nr:phosphate-starvation-inducible PsiE family protein [Candidatus Acidoferrales bacterium]
MAEKNLWAHFGDYLGKTEGVIYSVLWVLLFIAALATAANAGKMLWKGLGHWVMAADTLLVLDQLLVVLMLVEILHTVRISIHSHYLITEPFLVVGLIASIRRVLVITLEAANLMQGGTWSIENANLFRANMLELGLLGLLILILVFSITLLRRFAPAPKDVAS